MRVLFYNTLLKNLIQQYGPITEKRDFLIEELHPIVENSLQRTNLYSPYLHPSHNTLSAVLAIALSKRDTNISFSEGIVNVVVKR